jgi:hypothetical protein
MGPALWTRRLSLPRPCHCEHSEPVPRKTSSSKLNRATVGADETSEESERMREARPVHRVPHERGGSALALGADNAAVRVADANREVDDGARPPHSPAIRLFQSRPPGLPTPPTDMPEQKSAREPRRPLASCPRHRGGREARRGRSMMGEGGVFRDSRTRCSALDPLSSSMFAHFTPPLKTTTNHQHATDLTSATT